MALMPEHVSKYPMYMKQKPMYTKFYKHCFSNTFKMQYLSKIQVMYYWNDKIW